MSFLHCDGNYLFPTVELHLRSSLGQADWLNQVFDSFHQSDFQTETWVQEQTYDKVKNIFHSRSASIFGNASAKCQPLSCGELEGTKRLQEGMRNGTFGDLRIGQFIFYAAA